MSNYTASVRRQVKPFWFGAIGLFFAIIRPLFVKDVDANEDYECGWCQKPALKRLLFCSKVCDFMFERDVMFNTPNPGGDES